MSEQPVIPAPTPAVAAPVAPAVVVPVAPEVPPPPPELSTLDKIALLSSYANACQDPDLVKLMKGKPQGERLYEVFVSAVQREIETIMNGPAVQAPRVIQDAHVTAQNLGSLLHRLGAIMSAIEQGPALSVLSMLIQNLGGRVPAPAQQMPYPPHQPVQYQPQQPQQPQRQQAPQQQPQQPQQEQPQRPQSDNSLVSTAARPSRAFGAGSW